MAVGGTLTVTNTGAYENFTVKFSRNVEITNYRQREMGEVGDIYTRVNGGRNGKTDKVSSEGEKMTNLGTMDLGSKRYAIFDALRKLDGNKDDLSEQDLMKANSLKGQHGITDIKRDANAGVTTIFCEDGAVLRFDFETDAEKQVRDSKESATAQQQQKRADAKESQKQKEAKELHEHCKSDFEKFCEWFVGLFK